eukprot:6273788-Prymnesium_polylepis.2
MHGGQAHIGERVVESVRARPQRGDGDHACAPPAWLAHNGPRLRKLRGGAAAHLRIAGRLLAPHVCCVLHLTPAPHIARRRNVGVCRRAVPVAALGFLRARRGAQVVRAHGERCPPWPARLQA